MKIIVIGNGIGGFRAASTIRQLSRECDITIVSKETVPLYSPCVLPDYISDKIIREQTFVKNEEDYKKLGFKMQFGREVREIDASAKKIAIDNGKRHSFDKLILALGSDAVTFGESKKGIFKLKTLQDADEILKHKGKNAVVVGSGAIGIEVAIALHHRGYQVTVIEMLKRILPLGLDDKVARKVKGILQNSGIKVINGERAIEVVGQDHVEGLVTDKRQLPCDTLVWAIGMRPNVGLAKKAGVELGAKGGIRVNPNMETNIRDIYACGDCAETTDILTGKASLNLFWHNANRQGAVAGHNCMGIHVNYRGSENVLNVDVFGNHVAGFGHTKASMSEPKNSGKDDMGEDGISVIENERNGSYYRLVIFGDRCIGGQFINIRKDLGLVWSIMFRKRSIKELLRLFENEAVLDRRPWLQRIRPYFRE
jgi:NADH oxidase (H2O2-forming)